jgi:hypothetical protein
MSYRHDHRRPMMAAGLALGGLAFFIPHVFELAAIREQGMFSGPTYGRRLLITGLALFVAVLVTGLVARARDWRGSALWTWVGAIGGVVLLLVFLGPGNLWPLVIGLAAAYSALPIAAAGLAGHAVRRWGERGAPKDVLLTPPGYELERPPPPTPTPEADGPAH